MSKYRYFLVILSVLLIFTIFSSIQVKAVTIVIVASNTRSYTANIDISTVHPSVTTKRSCNGNSFNATVHSKITSFKIYTDGASLGTSDIYIVSRLYAHSGTFGSTGVPTGGILAESNYVHFTSASAGYYTWTFNSSQQYEMTADTKYAIGIYCFNGTWSSGAYLNWCVSPSNNTGGAGNAFDYHSSAYYNWTAWDYMFYVYGDTDISVPTTYNILLSDSFSFSYSVFLKGSTFNILLSNTITSTYTSLANSVFNVLLGYSFSNVYTSLPSVVYNILLSFLLTNNIYFLMLFPYSGTIYSIGFVIASMIVGILIGMMLLKRRNKKEVG